MEGTLPKQRVNPRTPLPSSFLCLNILVAYTLRWLEKTTRFSTWLNPSQRKAAKATSKEMSLKSQIAMADTYDSLDQAEVCLFFSFCFSFLFLIFFLLFLPFVRRISLMKIALLQSLLH
jgi:hypothetical protein